MVIFNKLPTYYAVGTATVDTGETTVTGTGTVWTSLQPGDLFGVHIGLAIPIAEVVSDTEFTLLFPWPGAAQTDADYCVQFIPRSVGVQEATRQLLLMLANGNLDAFAALLGGADKVPMFSGPGTLTLINKSELTSGVQADKQVADLAARAAYDNSPVDFKVLVSNTGDGRAALYTKLSNATADWSTPAYITGPTGADGVNPRGFYDNGIAYLTDDLVYSGGSTWVAKIETTGNAPPTLPTIENTQWRLFARAGAAVNPRGDYAAGTAYEPLDAVLYSGSTWIAKIPTTGNPPPTLPTTSNAQWQLMAEKGTDGTGTGDVVGPAGGVTVNQLAGYASTTGKLIKGLTWLEAGIPLPNYISDDFNLSNNATDPTNDIDFPSGYAASTGADPVLITHAAGTAQLDVAFGTGNGGRFDNAISDGWWNCFIITNGTTSSRGLSKSLDPTTQPNYPSGYTKYRRVGSILRISGVIKPFSQIDNEFLWLTAVQDVADNAPGTSAKTRTLTVPTGFSVYAILRILSVGVGGNNFRSIISALSQTDEAPGANSNTGGLFSGTSNAQNASSMQRRTNTSGQIRTRGETASSVELYIYTEGYVDRRS